MKEDKINQDRVAQFAQSEFDKFFAHPIWKCITDDIKDWYDTTVLMLEEAPLNDIHETLETGSYGRTVSGVNRLQGEASRLRQFLAIPILYKADRKLIEEEEIDNGPEEE